MPLGSSLAHPSAFGECLDRVLGVGPEVAQAPAVLRRPSVSLWPQLGLSWLFRRLRGEG